MYLITLGVAGLTKRLSQSHLESPRDNVVPIRNDSDSEDEDMGDVTDSSMRFQAATSSRRDGSTSSQSSEMGDVLLSRSGKPVEAVNGLSRSPVQPIRMDDFPRNGIVHSFYAERGVEGYDVTPRTLQKPSYNVNIYEEPEEMGEDCDFEYDVEQVSAYLRKTLFIPQDVPVNLWALADPPPGVRPNAPYPTLIKLALHGSPRRRLSLQEIYSALENRFEYYATRKDQMAWKVRSMSFIAA